MKCRSHTCERRATKSVWYVNTMLEFWVCDKCAFDVTQAIQIAITHSELVSSPLDMDLINASIELFVEVKDL